MLFDLEEDVELSQAELDKVRPTQPPTATAAVSPSAALLHPMLPSFSCSCWKRRKMAKAPRGRSGK